MNSLFLHAFLLCFEFWFDICDWQTHPLPKKDVKNRQRVGLWRNIIYLIWKGHEILSNLLLLNIILVLSLFSNLLPTLLTFIPRRHFLCLFYSEWQLSLLENCQKYWWHHLANSSSNNHTLQNSFLHWNQSRSWLISSKLFAGFIENCARWSKSFYAWQGEGAHTLLLF